ncbi:class I SAM-dependent methyltransferase [Nocardioides marmorisolisilvae]|uniref:Class I SAM-dependent methyltransferase n=1 Tax=Nocardioides marmorisolisilvae TaxID=1542737 RepID=A0A3N0DNR6_9ACTN|nr:class I SAM-dependent methyltransferase [Nocardioides marmorisolisilvae]RNL77290.1 class I SAM-dependent methyltransferase [Nocardioides marmorisolisilvae]
MGVRIDERGIRITGSLKGALDEPLDLRLDGHRVWSFRPRRDGFKVGRGLLVPWPEALTGVLDGRAEIDVVRHDGGASFFSGAFLFGESDDPVVLTDDLGNRLSIDKVGQLQRSFEAEPGPARSELAQEARRIVDDLREHCDLDAFLCHGGLLGAARDGHLVGHDVDLAFYSSFRHPFDVIRETRHAERTLSRLGWQVVRMSGASFKVWVALPSGKRGSIDVLAAFHVGTTFHLAGSLSGDLDRRHLLPLREIELEGTCFPAPANVRKVLEFTYGPGWSVPDPAFRFDHPPGHVRKMAQWFRGSRARLPYWQDLHRRQQARQEPSEFAEWVDARTEPHSRILELGAGDGRDTIWLSEQGHVATGTDFCGAARTTANQAARDAGVPVTFTALNLESLHSLLTIAARTAAAHEVTHVYGRRLIDVLAPSGRDGLWRFCAIVGRRGGRTFLEYRKENEPETLYAEIERYGGRVVDKVVRRGLAPVGKEDPVIIRLVLTWEKP